jgi:O-antigen ligase
MRAAIARALSERGRDAVVVGAAMLIAAVAGVYGVGHPKRALGLGVVVLAGALLFGWMTNGDASTRSYRWIPLAWVSLFFVTDHRFDGRGPLEVAAGDVGVQHLIQLFLYGLVAILVMRSRRLVLSQYPRAVPKGLLLAWPVLALASSMWSLIPLYTFVRAIQLLVLVALALLVVRIWVADPIAGERVWLATLRLFVQLVTVLALVGFLLQPWVGAESLAAGRFTWPGAHPGTASTYLGCAFVILLAGGRSATSFTRLGYWARLVLFGAALYLGQTRSVIAAVLLAVALVLWFQGRQRPLARFLGIPYYLAGIVLAFTLAASQVVGYLSRGESLESFTTLNSRIPLWEFAFAQFDSLGDWVGGFGYGATRILLLPQFQWAGSAHSTWVELLLGVGIIGLVLAVADLFILGVRLTRRQGSDLANRIAIALLGFFLMASFVSEVLVLPGIGFGLLALLHAPALARRRGLDATLTYTDADPRLEQAGRTRHP